MAEHGMIVETTGSPAEAENYAERQAMYLRFLTALKYSTSAIAIVLILMAIFLT